MTNSLGWKNSTFSLLMVDSAVCLTIDLEDLRSFPGRLPDGGELPMGANGPQRSFEEVRFPNFIPTFKKGRLDVQSDPLANPSALPMGDGREATLSNTL